MKKKLDHLYYNYIRPYDLYLTLILYCDILFAILFTFIIYLRLDFIDRYIFIVYLLFRELYCSVLIYIIQIDYIQAEYIFNTIIDYNLWINVIITALLCVIITRIYVITYLNNKKVIKIV